MPYVKFIIPSDIDEAWLLLEQAGVNPLYSEESSLGAGCIFGTLPESLVDKELPYPWEETDPPAIDWSAQWALHAEGFRDGLIRIPIESYGEVLLKPGPGFGDLSHPSTRMMLRLMPRYVKNSCVVDVGCGSGVLSLCASAYGADPVYGIDISPEALIHSLENLKLNQMDNVAFMMPDELMFLPKPPVILMNMIRSEQEQAWRALMQLHPVSAIVITSGILTSETDDYLLQTETWGWNLEELIEDEGWSCFVFSK